MSYAPMTVAAARWLSRNAAERCGVNADDEWKVYGGDYLKDADALLQDIGAAGLLIACQQAIYALKGREHDQFLRDAIAKATGVRP